MIVKGISIVERREAYLDAPVVVVFDRYRNPLAVAIEHQPDVTVFYTRADPEFNEMLHIAGVSDPVDSVARLRPPPVPAHYKPYNSLVLPS